MKEILNLGVRGTGYIDKRYGTESTITFSLFECPICLSHYELKRSRGLAQNTCNDCKSTQLVKHAMSGTKPYTVWQGMLQRCNNPNNRKYHIYGGKGIKVCDKWQTFEGFWEDVKDLYREDLTIDRPDSSKDYSLETTRWISKRQNSSETTKRRPVIQMRQVMLPVKHFVEMQWWESAKRAGDTLGLVPAHITATCMEKRQTHGGFGWKYAE